MIDASMVDRYVGSASRLSPSATISASIEPLQRSISCVDMPTEIDRPTNQSIQHNPDLMNASQYSTRHRITKGGHRAGVVWGLDHGAFGSAPATVLPVEAVSSASVRDPCARDGGARRLGSHLVEAYGGPPGSISVSIDRCRLIGLWHLIERIE